MKTIDVCIGTDRARNVRVRLSLLVVNDVSGTVEAEHYHSVSLAPDDDVTATMMLIEQHLANPNGGIPGAPWPGIPPEVIAEITAYIGIAHTPERVAKRRAEKAAAALIQAQEQAAAQARAQAVKDAEAARIAALVAAEVAKQKPV